MAPDLLAEVARDADVAARAVDAVWGTDWPRSVTVVVGDAVELGAAPSTDPSRTALPAAAVTVPGGPDGVGSSHVVVDAAVWTTLSPVGRRVVLTHEVAHVATDSVHQVLPRWLEEGLADDIGWLGSGVTVGAAAREALDQVAASGLPAALPSDADLALDAPGAGAAYGEAYVAARLLAQTYGQEVLVRVYRRAARELAASTTLHPVTTDEAVDAALRAETGEGLSSFVAAWRAELARLAAPTP